MEVTWGLVLSIVTASLMESVEEELDNYTIPMYFLSIVSLVPFSSVCFLMSTIVDQIMYTGDKPINMSNQSYDQSGKYPLTSRIGMTYIYDFLIDLGVVSSVRSFQTTCIMNQQGVVTFPSVFIL